MKYFLELFWKSGGRLSPMPRLVKVKILFFTFEVKNFLRWKFILLEVKNCFEVKIHFLLEVKIYLSIWLLILIALFQSFKVCFPAWWTSSLGVINSVLFLSLMHLTLIPGQANLVHKSFPSKFPHVTLKNCSPSEENLIQTAVTNYV